MNRYIILTLAALGSVALGLSVFGIAQGPGLATLASSSATYITSAPTGSYSDISGDSGLTSISVNTHDGGYDYPVQYTDGTHGTTTFNDYNYWGRLDQIAVPNVTTTGGFFPSTGSDGHLVVIDTASRMAYDFWRLCTDGNGTPVTCSTNSSPTSIGQILSYSLNTRNGVPVGDNDLGGDTASGLSGLVGDILPAELGGAAVPHALSVIIDGALMRPNPCTEVPAASSDGSVSGATFCEGAKLAMDPSIDVDSLEASPAAKSIMKAFQLYGGIIVDQGGCSGCMGIYSDLPSQPDLAGLSSNLLSHLWIYYGN